MIHFRLLSQGLLVQPIPLEARALAASSAFTTIFMHATPWSSCFRFGRSLLIQTVIFMLPVSDDDPAHLCPDDRSRFRPAAALLRWTPVAHLEGRSCRHVHRDSRPRHDAHCRIYRCALRARNPHFHQPCPSQCAASHTCHMCNTTTRLQSAVHACLCVRYTTPILRPSPYVSSPTYYLASLHAHTHAPTVPVHASVASLLCLSSSNCVSASVFQHDSHCCILTSGASGLHTQIHAYLCEVDPIPRTQPLDPPWGVLEVVGLFNHSMRHKTAVLQYSGSRFLIIPTQSISRYRSNISASFSVILHQFSRR